MRLRHALLVPVLLLVAGTPARAGVGPILHEQIPPDPHEDLALQVSLDGDIPAALDTKSGVVAAPDPRRPVGQNDPSYNNGVGLPGGPRDRSTDATFTPDRDTRRPDIQGYDEPFTPSTAPFKRLQAFDAVTNDYQLYVRDPALVPLPVNAQLASDGSEEQFFADMVIDVAPGRRARIPSVGPGARVVRARLGIGAQDVAMRLTRDGADNWFAEGLDATSRARLVMEVTIARGVFGGEFADANWGQLPPVGKLPERPAKAARDVAAAIGVSTALRPRDNVNRLVTWFRGFVDSNESPREKGDIYLDLALSKKGVCRHRAFAFLITAQSIGIPTRMVINEAHAWVEVHDGTLWRRIDLGGAGRMPPASNLVPERPAYQAPPDPFQWPHGSERGDDMVENARQRARQQQQQQQGPGGDGGAASAPSSSPMSSPSGDPAAFDDAGAPLPAPSGSSSTNTPSGEKDDRPTSTITVTVTDPDAHRGAPLHVRGDVKADGERCGHVVVELYLRDARDPRRLLLLGTAATAPDGSYAAAIVIPGSTPLGDYDLVARTQGDAHCGRGGSN